MIHVFGKDIDLYEKATLLINNKRIQDNNSLEDIVLKYRRNHKKIVFVNGCFDLFHIGHLDLLKEAKSQGDILIVGLNSDSSIKHNKGNNRPIICEEDRTCIIESLIYVDHVIIFQENTPFKLIEIVKPDIIVKESEYRYKKIAEIDYIRKNNCELFYYEKRCDISTSSIINKILELEQLANATIDE